jgi:hypothetical protein
LEARALSLLFSICVVSVCQAQNQPPTAPAPAAPGAAAPAAPRPAAPQNAQPPAPDYPDPRTLTFGAFVWATGLDNSGPNLVSGSTAPDNETLDDLGKARPVAGGVEVSLPITRTGSLHFESLLAKGDGNVTTTVTTDVFGNTYGAGTALVPQYSIFASKLYLDDLLFPHKFPVAKFRLKSLWEFQYIHMKTVVDAPALNTATASAAAVGTKQIFLPTFGIAAEYALTPHVLARVDASGFGLPGKSNIWDANVTLSYRRGSWELYAGGKALHFKSSGNATEYVTDTLAGVLVGLRWHWSL